MGKHPGLVVWTHDPLNIETPLEVVCESSVTPTELFYVRNHGPVPEVDPASYQLAVRGLVSEELDLSLRELRQLFEHTQLGATLMCAGNRRSELAARLWQTELDVALGPCELLIRVWDSAACTQPHSPAQIWNLKGYMNNAWHRVEFTVA